MLDPGSRRKAHVNLPPLIEQIFELKTGEMLKKGADITPPKLTFCGTRHPVDLAELRKTLEGARRFFRHERVRKRLIGEVHPHGIGKQRNDPAEAVKLVRDRWGLGNLSPIPSLSFVIGHAGISLPRVSWPENVNSPLAMAGWWEQQPFIAVNAEAGNAPVEDLRLALATELGRLVLSERHGKPPFPKDEVAARFGRAFLLPDSAKPLFSVGRFLLAEISMLASQYGVSCATISYRLTDWGFYIGKDSWASIRRQWRRSIVPPVQSQCNESTNMDVIWESQRRFIEELATLPQFTNASDSEVTPLVYSGGSTLKSRATAVAPQSR
jgi:hypothetical protein